MSQNSLVSVYRVERTKTSPIDLVGDTLVHLVHYVWYKTIIICKKFHTQRDFGEEILHCDGFYNT